MNQISIALLLYSHVPTALLALIFSTYVLIKARNFAAFLFFNVCVTFAMWAAFDLSAWFSLLGSANTMFTWSLLDFISVLMFFFAYYFLYTFVTGRDLPRWQKAVGILLLAAPAIVAFLGINIPTYDLNACIALEDGTYTKFTYISEGFILLATLTFIILQYRRSADKDQRSRVLLAGTGVFIFLSFMFSSGLLVSLLASSDASSYVYNYLIYGLFGMPVFLIYLGYLIVRYHAFNLKMFGAQALVAALIAVLASEYAFVSTFATRILITVTLLLTTAAGSVLIRSVRSEIEQREHIELLAKDLEKANKQQIILIHFITHQIKGFLSKSRSIFSLFLEGDLGPLSDQMKPLVQEGFDSDTKGVNTIQEILNAANIKNGKVTYQKEPFDLKALLEEIAKAHTSILDGKHLSLTSDLGDSPVTFHGDRAQLYNAFKNLLDNAIKYTPSGSISESLKKEGDKLVYRIEDTGVGITSEDMQHLFTEGGHGKESQKINVDSTGFGLYIVKNIIEAHNGKVWAESEGAGKGSRFIVELPA